jgi:hypothetical protein
MPDQIPKKINLVKSWCSPASKKTQRLFKLIKKLGRKSWVKEMHSVPLSKLFN